MRDTWRKFRTCSTLGNVGRNIAWDNRNEDQNGDLKSWGCSDPTQIDGALRMLNGMKEVDEPLRGYLGLERSSVVEYTATKQNQVDAIVSFLRGSLGDSDAFSRAIRSRKRPKRSPFGGSGLRPWQRVANVDGTLPAYIRTQLKTAPL